MFLDFSFYNPGGFLIAFIPALLNIGILIYVLWSFPKNRITNIFLLLVLSLILWQFNDAVSRISITAETADSWDCLFSIGWIFVGPLCLLFSLSYIGEKKIVMSRLLNIVLIGPSLFFTALYQGRYYQHNYHYSNFWGWINYHNENTTDKIQIYWITVQVLVATILLFYHAYRSRDKNHIVSRQSAIIAIGIAIPAIAGIIAQVIMPLLYNSISIPVTSTFMSFFSLATVIGFSKYQLFSVSELINTEQLMENMPVMVVSISPQFHVTYINPIGIKNLGVESENGDGKRLEDLFRHRSSLEGIFFKEAVNASIKGETVQNIESTINNRSGQKMEIVSSFIPIFNNKIIQGAMVVARDISDLKKSFQIISHQQQLLEEAQQISHIGSWEWDIKNNIVTWSDELFRIYGYKPGAFDVSFEKFIECVHPEDRGMAEEIVKKAYIDHNPFVYYHRTIHPDGKIVIISAKGKVILDEHNNPFRMSGTGQDVTEIISKEELLKKQNEELLKTNKELDRFVYSTSHDLRAPLKSLLGLTDLIKENMEPGDTEQKERMDMMEQSVKKLDDFIEEILNYSRNTRMEVAKEHIDFSEMMKQIKKNHKFMEGTKGFTIKLQIHQEEKFISDKHRVDVVLSNLISNAVKYQDISKKHRFMKIIIHCSKENANIEIEDNGIGVADKDKEKIFEMFYRATRLSTGSGLGLYIVKEALVKLGGTIHLESELKKGTKFTIMLPSQIVIN